ncbi:hypothetical protein GQ598_02720 [Gilliamella sp. Pas-s95]|nr:hypothetical protein [Gilliamella sp. Pas-s95]
MYSFSAQALSTKTLKTIEGTAPYFTFDGGQTKATSLDSLLAIKLPDGRVFTPSTNPSSKENPIILPVGTSFSSIGMLVPPSVESGSSVSFNDLVNKYHYWGDDDGDGQGANGVKARGDLSFELRNKFNFYVSRNDSVHPCLGPYQIILHSSGGELITQYGIPNRAHFDSKTVRYYLDSSPSISVCYVRPNSAPRISERFDSFNGFLVKSTDPSSYGLNFPTTGADGLYFDLIIAGVDGSQLTWSPVTRGGITATVKWTRPNTGSYTDSVGNIILYDKWIIKDKSKYVTRVTLNGPRASRRQRSSSNPRPLSVPSLPQTFELEGRDRSGNVVVKYGFVLKQWFVNRGNELGNQASQSSWCSSLGYRLSRIKDLTFKICGRNCSTSPSYPPGYDVNTRPINSGFFTEWGDMKHYANANFFQGLYWMSDIKDKMGTAVGSDSGGVWGKQPTGYDRKAVCVTP